MNRRDCTKQLLAGVLATPVIFSATQEQANAGEASISQRGRVRLDFGQGIIRVKALLFLSKGSRDGFRLRLDRPFKQFDESRTDLSNIPLLGSIVRPSLATRFAGSRQIGGVYLTKETLVAEVDPVVIRGIDTTVLLHGKTSWEIGKKPTPVTLQDIPLLGSMFRAGNVRRKGPELLILLTPTILDDDV